jgi:hypothetical protein
MSTKLIVRACICIAVCFGMLVSTHRLFKVVKVEAATNEPTTPATGSHAPVSSRSTWLPSHTLRSIQGGQQTRKNIQVLKGLPESQLYLVMNFVATSLGVQCAFCHVQQGKDPNTGRTNWIWESDDKPQKQTARRMMQMVLSIKANNKTDFRVNEVTCFTCHRGHTKPVGLPSLPLTRSGHEPGLNEEVAREPTNLPSVEQVFAKYVETIGGSAASATKTLVMRGRRVASQDRNWPNDITIVNPDKFLLVATTPQGEIRQIVNGEKGWVINGKNVRDLSPTEAADASRSWEEVFSVIKAKPSPGMAVKRVEKVGDSDAYVVENVSDTKIERYYFDSQSGLLLRKITLNRTMLMPFPQQVDFEDYRTVDGIKVPFTIRYSAIDTFDSWTRTFTEVKRNVTVDDALFGPRSSPQQ